MIQQYNLKQTADVADWLIGDRIFTPKISSDALRSLKAPGTAYDNKIIGKDPQPANMRDFVNAIRR
jgi:Zn-dependent metalloprotease